MNLSDNTTKRMRVFKLTDFQTDLLCQSLTKIKRQCAINLEGKISEEFKDDKFIINSKDGYCLWKKEIKLLLICLHKNIERES